MDAVVQSILSGAPILVLHLVTAVAMLAVGISIYMWVTPYADIKLVRAGNDAAAVALGGAMLSLAVPLAACLAGSVNTLDIMLWGCVTLIIQIAAFRGVALVLRGLPRRIAAGEVSAAILLVSVELSVAVIVAAGVR